MKIKTAEIAHNIKIAMRRHALRIGFGFVITCLFVLNSVGVMRLTFMEHAENLCYDLRLNLSMSDKQDSRIVIVDIDEKSLAAEGRWPWSRNKLAQMMDRLFKDYGIAVLGFDVVFAERDESSGLALLEQMGRNGLKDNVQYRKTLAGMRGKLDYDALFAHSLENRPVVLGYYFTDNQQEAARISGRIPAPVFTAADMGNVADIPFVRMTGYGANLPVLQQWAASAGHFNPYIDPDGVSRRIPVLIEYKGNYYESLSLAMVRTLLGNPPIVPGFPAGSDGAAYRKIEWLGVSDLKVPVDDRVTALVPYRGHRGSFRYIPATDVIHGRVAKEVLDGAIVLVGTSAPGLMDLRSTPVDSVYPGVEVHANIIAGILDQTIKHKPAYVVAADLLTLLLCGVLLSVLLPLLSPVRAIIATAVLMVGICIFNAAAWQENLVLPIASSLSLVTLLFVCNMSYGFLLEARSRRQITGLFGQYVHPELVHEMSLEPDRFNMQSKSQEMTVLFSDICSFTVISESLEPAVLSALMNEYLTAMTKVIQKYRGTIDKYIGDAIMSFWGAPLDDPDHVKNAVLAALEMQERAAALRGEFTAKGWPELYMGIGINTGMMNVGNMGSQFRMAYTVMGDSVNLASRLEGLSRQYGVDIIVGETTRNSLPDMVFQELDRVRVKGRHEPVIIFLPLGLANKISDDTLNRLHCFEQVLTHYRNQEWDASLNMLQELLQQEPGSRLYQLYLDRINHYRVAPPPADWDGVFSHTTKH